MNVYLILLLVLIALFLILWFARRTRPAGDVLEDFPIPFTEDKFPEPPRRSVSIGVERDGNGVPVRVAIEPSNQVVGPEEQAAWSARGEGKIEIRFSPNSTPFAGESFTSARGGTALSGKPSPKATLNSALSYLVLLTTVDGYLLRQEATLTVAPERRNPKDERSD